MSSPFVQVQGTKFVLRGRPFLFTGANCYYLVPRLANPGTVQQALEALDAAKELGVTVIRTWFYNDGDQWGAVQPKPGVYNEQLLLAIDRLVVECGKRGLRLLPTLTNYWPDFGGMSVYARWGSNNPGATSENFYTNDVGNGLFRKFIAEIIWRQNTLTGMLYRDDPTILAWDIVNEPECKDDTAATTVATWLDATAKYIKTLDQNHMVTAGSEGFFGPSRPEYQAYNPFNTASKGCDFIREFSSPALDFACIHMWHDQWMPGTSDGQQRDSARKYIAGHEKACMEVLGKPLVIEEYGAKAGASTRFPLVQMVHSAVESSAAAGGAIVGSCLWMIAARSYDDYDGYTVYLPSTSGGGPARNDDPAVITEVKRYAKRLPSLALNQKLTPVRR